MKKSVCLFLQIHQPTSLRLYRFFDIGKDSHYYDDFVCRMAVTKAAQKCYLPMNALLMDVIRQSKGKFKLSFGISGSAIEQLERYAPEVLDSFRELAQTGCVEFVCETYNHSLVSLISEQEFEHQVLKHKKAVEDLFGVTPKSFLNTSLIYSDTIGRSIRKMGFDVMLTEGARHIMGWRSPNYVYTDDLEPGLKLLLRNYSLCDDVCLRFEQRDWNEWPLTSDKFASWIANADGDIVNLFMDYENFGIYHNKVSGIQEFLQHLPDAILSNKGIQFVTPSEASGIKAAGELSIPEVISCEGEERDTSAWLGNELQQEAFNKLYALTEKLSILNSQELWSDFGHLQESENFYYMNTKFFGANGSFSKRSPYDTPYEAFINYMNVLSDFIIRVNNAMAEK